MGFASFGSHSTSKPSQPGVLQEVEGIRPAKFWVNEWFAVRIKYLCLCQFELASMMQFDSESGKEKSGAGIEDVRSSSEQLIEYLISE